MKSIRDSIDLALMWLKWPVAVVCVGLLPGALIASLALLVEVTQKPATMLMFLGGAAAYLLVWMAILRRSRFTFFLTFEHELTHVLFALLTFHSVTNFRVTMTRGGVMGHRGQGNWLITIAPYFVPLLSLTLIALLWLAPVDLLDVGKTLIGASFAYHVTSKMRQTHAGQSDLQQVGMLFSWMFLPTANLVFSGAVLAYLLEGTPYIRFFLSNVIRATRDLYALSI